MKRIMIVGNCNKDGPAIKEFIENEFVAEVDDIKTHEEAKEILENEKDNYDLIAVNRISLYDNKHGIELINYIVDKDIRIPIMIITNYEDVRDYSVGQGAVRGFGKKSIYGDQLEAKEILSKYLDKK